MQLADVDYNLPPAAIAQRPVEPRDAARLLVDRGDISTPADRHVSDLHELLRPGDVLVVNDTRVLPARLLLCRPGGAPAEVLLLEPVDASMGVWIALARPGRKIRPGCKHVSDSISVVVGEVVGPDGRRLVTIESDDPISAVSAAGVMPLPPYISTPLDDPDRYQTVYAARAASAAAPTAGLHLTDALLDRIRDRGVAVARVELVVGLDTFRPVVVEDLDQHRMHGETYHVPEATIDACAAAKHEGRRVVAVGTTTVRALESAAATGCATGRTEIFIRRPFDWQVVDALMTNFHLPRTTLLLMIDAFVGPRWRMLYGHALASGYRFLSFGDAMFLERGP